MTTNSDSPDTTPSCDTPQKLIKISLENIKSHPTQWISKIDPEKLLDHLTKRNTPTLECVLGRPAIRSKSLADLMNEPSNDNMEVDEQPDMDLYPPIQGQKCSCCGEVFEATWKGESMEDGSELVNVLAAPIFDELVRGQKRPNPDAGSDDATPSIRCRVSRDNSGGPPGDSGPPNKLTFRDCAGHEKQVSYLKSAVLDPLSGKADQKTQIQRFGMQPPKGILFYGPPGTEKTRLALALSNELKKVLGHKVHFIYRKGKDVASKWQSSENLRRVFEEAKQNQPAVVFFDELDGLCPNRDNSTHQTNITITTTMLGLMDELPKGKVFVIGATNRLETIDPALRRPGRFDKHLEFLPPSEKGRFDILRIHTTDWKVKPEVELLRGLSNETIGFSGADLAKLCLDTFDNAMSRILCDCDGNFNSPTLMDLAVEDRDWRAALGKMKPSNAAIFGSCLYTPSLSAGEHATMLLESDVNDIVAAMTGLLPSKKSLHVHSSIMSLHVTSESEAVLGNLDDYVISETLRSQELGQYTMYTISPATLSSVPMRQWSTRIHDAFTQALDSAQPSILYLQQTDELWNMLKNAKLGFALNLKQEVERLRGKFVLLLTTGPHPASLPLDNPLKKVLVGSAKIFEVLPPSEDERYQFFETVFADALTCTAENWTGDQIIHLDLALERAVNYTEAKELGSMLCLHDQLKEFLVTAGDAPVNEILKTMMDIIGQYGMNYPAPIPANSDSEDDDEN